MGIIAYDSKKNIRNIFIFIDANSLLTLEKTQGFLDKKSLKKKFKSFDLDVFECDGHDVSNIFDLYSKLAKRTKSCVVIFDTIKGKGINFMENNSIWHHKVPNIKEYDKGIYALRNSLNY